MEAIHTISRMDTNGRVTIPKGIRESYNLRVGEPLEFIPSEDGTFEMRKFPLRDRVIEGAKDLHHLIVQNSENLDPEYIERINRHLKMVMVLMNKAVRDSEQTR